MLPATHSLSQLILANAQSSRRSTLRRGHIRNSLCPCATSTHTTCGFWSQLIWTEAEESMFSETSKLCTSWSNNTASAKRKGQRRRIKIASRKKTQIKTLMPPMPILITSTRPIMQASNLSKKIHSLKPKQPHRRSRHQTRLNTTLSLSRNTLRDHFWFSNESSISECGLCLHRIRTYSSSKRATCELHRLSSVLIYKT